MSPELVGVAITEVVCRSCSERHKYGDLDDVSECPDCGIDWRLRG